MTGRVEGKVAFVSGAARGQGRAHAVRLAEEGADVIAVDICAPIDGVRYPAPSEADLSETKRLVEAAGRRAVSLVVDTRDLAALVSAAAAGAEALGGIDILVANAGICIVAAWNDTTPEIFRTTIEVNLIGTWNTVQAVAPHLIRSGGGSIVLTSSAAGLKGLPFLSAYVASKHALTGLARSLAAELAQYRIRVNSLHPGGVNTPMGDPEATAAFGPALEANPGVGAMLASMLPDALAEPVDQANAVLFLASDEAKFITAHALAVDAGNSQM